MAENVKLLINRLRTRAIQRPRTVVTAKDGGQYSLRRVIRPSGTKTISAPLGLGVVLVVRDHKIMRKEDYEDLANELKFQQVVGGGRDYYLVDKKTTKTKANKQDEKPIVDVGALGAVVFPNPEND